MPSPKYPLWWIPALTGLLFVLWLLGATASICIVLFVWATAGYGIGWHRALRSFRLRVVYPVDPKAHHPPDDCPFDHNLKDLLAIEPGLEVRCNGCNILIGKGAEF